MDVVPNLRTRVPTMTICVAAPRVLRWTFRRADESITCELGLDAAESAYELRLNPSGNVQKVATERFDDAMPAFQRQAAIERLLVQEGWMLEGFKSGPGATLAQA